MGRHDHSRITRMNTGKLYVLKHTANQGGLPIGNTVYIQLKGIFEELIEEHRLTRSDIEDFADYSFHLVHVVDDEHASTTQDKGGSQEDGETDATRQFIGLLGGLGNLVGGCFNPIQSRISRKRLRSSAASIIEGEVPMILTPCASNSVARLSGFARQTAQ